MKKALIAIVALGASVGTWQLVASGGAGASTPPTSLATTLDITFKEGFCGDAGSSCKTIGDQQDLSAYGNTLIFTIPITSGGQEIGYEEGQCVYLKKRTDSDFCTYDLHLSDGIVSVQGTLPTSSRKAPAIPVTGGTRAYLGADGTLRLIAGTTFDYRLQLVIP